MTETGRARVGAYIKARREVLGMTQRRLAELAGVTDRQVGRWEKATEGRVNDSDGARGIERALGWSDGSIRRIAEGGEPVLRDAPIPGMTVTQTATGAIATIGDVASADLLAVIQVASEELRRRESES